MALLYGKSWSMIVHIVGSLYRKGLMVVLYRASMSVKMIKEVLLIYFKRCSKVRIMFSISQTKRTTLGNIRFFYLKAILELRLNLLILNLLKLDLLFRFHLAALSEQQVLIKGLASNCFPLINSYCHCRYSQVRISVFFGKLFLMLF